MLINSDSIEFEGNTLDEAVQNAVSTLGVQKNKLEIKIVCEEKMGLFGMKGSKSAKIKVSIK